MLEYRRFPDETGFWDEFSVINEITRQKRRMKWTELVRACKAKRNAAFKDDVIAAKAEYGDTFDQYFRYIKTGREFLMTQPRAISRKYRQLREMPQIDDDEDDS